MWLKQIKRKKEKEKGKVYSKQLAEGFGFG